MGGDQAWEMGEGVENAADRAQSGNVVELGLAVGCHGRLVSVRGTHSTRDKPAALPSPLVQFYGEAVC